MKADIHPTYQRAVVQCACGNTFETRSTLADIHVEICARERFRQRYSGTAKKTGA